jgi:hypothetical protein
MFSSATSWIGTLSEKYPRQICLVQLHLIKTSVGSICLMYSMMPLLSNKRHFPWDTSNVADMTDSTKDVLLFPATRPLRQSCLACSLMPLHSIKTNSSWDTPTWWLCLECSNRQPRPYLMGYIGRDVYVFNATKGHCIQSRQFLLGHIQCDKNDWNGLRRHITQIGTVPLGNWPGR